MKVPASSSSTPGLPGYPSDLCAVAGLKAGDRLLSVGPITYPYALDPDVPAVLVADVRSPAADADPTSGAVEVVTSNGSLYVPADTTCRVLRDDTVTSQTVLLISRRHMLHASLLTFGVPVIRRTPVDAGRSTPVVTGQEWDTAPLIVIDGYLAGSTLRNMWARSELTERQQIIMVGTDPDDPSVYQRQVMAHARTLAVLPYDNAGLADLFASATGVGESDNPWFGILTNRSTGQNL